MKIGLKRLPNGKDLPLPGYATPGAAGLDLLAAIECEMELKPGERAAIPCGIAIELPRGVEAQVRPRSGLALHHGVTVLNAQGTVDSDFRGEIKAILINQSKTPFIIVRGTKIAQLVIARHEQAEIAESDNLSGTARGQSGFGSTGMTVKS
ncbi:MAG: dUTP diphosphatase [Rhizomicrobium sp.]